jgi:membrane protein YdbS with pleckstrin-like domain
MALLQGHEAFTQLSPEQIANFAERGTIELYRQGEQIIRQGETDDRFYILLRGELKAIDTSQEIPRLLNYHTVGDIVGLRAIIRGTGVRAATIEAVDDSVVAAYSKVDWDWLLEQRPEIIDDIHEMETLFDARALIDFPGRQPDEVVVAATKRHFLAFMAKLTWPIGLLIVPVVFLLAAELLGVQFLEAITDNLVLTASIIIPFVVAAILIAFYHYFDWRNDDLIITTKRVIHIERILFYGEERHEAPLMQIQDVTVKSEGALDLLFDVDDIQIKTASVGLIAVDNVPSAQRLSRLILQERERARSRAAASDTQSIRRLIEERLEKSPLAMAKPAAPEPKVVHSPLIPRVPIPKFDRNYFLPSTRQVANIKGEQGIIWRKHYYILLANVGLPLLAVLVSFYLLSASFLSWWPFLGRQGAPLIIQGALGLAFLGSLFWYFWEYDDWWRDTYIVTSTKIIDVTSTPFRLHGEQQREGSFDSIQNITYNIPDFFSKILNLGDVIIETAGTGRTFTFEKVLGPSAVQEEIFRRWDAFQQRRRELVRDATTRQVVSVLGEYDDYRRGPAGSL